MSYTQLDPLEQGCITFFFLAARAMYSGDQRFVATLHSVLTTFTLRSVQYDYTKARRQITSCVCALGPARLPPDLLLKLLQSMQDDSGRGPPGPQLG